MGMITMYSVMNCHSATTIEVTIEILMMTAHVMEMITTMESITKMGVATRMGVATKMRAAMTTETTMGVVLRTNTNLSYTLVFPLYLFSTITIVLFQFIYIDFFILCDIQSFIFCFYLCFDFT